MRIRSLFARRIKNSRAEDTIEVVVNKKFFGAAPSGASKGKHEVVDYINGVEHSIDFLNNYFLHNQDEIRQKSFDEFEDLAFFEPLINVIGGNPVVALQSSVLKAMAEGSGVWKFLNPYTAKMPVPLGNCIGGGKHISAGVSSIDIQELLLIPKARSFKDNAILNLHVYKKLKGLFKCNNLTDEGALAIDIRDVAALELLWKFLSDTNNTLGLKVGIGADFAASSLFDGKFYRYNNFSKRYKNRKLDRTMQIKFVNRLCNEDSGFSLEYIEDPLQEEDFAGFKKIKCKFVCGDDLLATNIEILARAAKEKSVNAAIVKINQCGSIVKAKKFLDFAKKNDIVPVISHRSGETYDTIISDLAVAWKCPFIKCGIFGAEREAKIKRLLSIEEML